ncbi:Conserved hypothetical protein (plasmid) [Sinorhizobium meliloti SM11]|nr:Conserved hypothetical protein [Sinorhizobium meliloti SM11]
MLADPDQVGTKAPSRSFERLWRRKSRPPNRETPMGSAKDKVAGKANELAGKAKKAAGDATDNNSLRAKGAAQEAKGGAQQAKGKLKDAVKGAVDKT